MPNLYRIIMAQERRGLEVSVWRNSSAMERSALHRKLKALGVG